MVWKVGCLLEVGAGVDIVRVVKDRIGWWC